MAIQTLPEESSARSFTCPLGIAGLKSTRVERPFSSRSAPSLVPIHAACGLSTRSDVTRLLRSMS